MAHILAIEPDRERSVILKRLVKESLNIDVVLAESADQAIAKLKSSGELKQITDKWMGAAAGAPELH